MVSGPAATNSLLLKFWYDVKLPAILKKHEVDVFVTGAGICSLTARIAQCLVIDDLSYLHFPSFAKKMELFFLKRYMRKFIQKADRIITVSAYLENEIISRYPADKRKISVIYDAGKNFHPLTEDEKEKVRAEHTMGKNYFLFAGEIDQRKNIISLLKAFSVFKKRQKSDWKLVLAGHISPRFKNFSRNLKSYRYRDEVILMGQPGGKEIEKLVGAAYGFVYPATAEGWSTTVLGPLRSQVPVIVTQNSAMAEVAGDAALYTDPLSYKDIAEKMMLLYKDESLRKKLIERGSEVAEQFTWEKAAMNFMQTVRETVGIKTGIYT